MFFSRNDLIVPQDERSIYYQLDGFWGKAADTCDLPSHVIYSKLNFSYARERESQIKNLAIMILLSPLAISGKAISFLIYRFKGIKILPRDYDQALNRWLNKNFYRHTNPKHFTLLIDFFIRNQIQANDCIYDTLAFEISEVCHLFTFDGALSALRERVQERAIQLLVICRPFASRYSYFDPTDMNEINSHTIRVNHRARREEQELVERCGFTWFPYETQLTKDFARKIFRDISVF